MRGCEQGWHVPTVFRDSNGGQWSFYDAGASTQSLVLVVHIGAGATYSDFFVPPVTS